MKGLNHFVVHIPKKWSDSYKTESGLELYADRRWSLKEVGNTVVKIVETPLNYTGPIQNGFELFIDINTLSQQSYVIGGELENQHLIDRKNKLYKIDNSLIIAYRKDKNSGWIGFGDTVLCSKIKESKENVTSNLIYVPGNHVEKVVEGKYVLKILNETVEELGVTIGDTIYVEKNLFIDVRLEDEQLVRIRTRDILGVAV